MSTLKCKKCGTESLGLGWPQPDLCSDCYSTMSTLTEPEYTEEARRFCRENDYNNVDLVRRVMKFAHSLKLEPYVPFREASLKAVGLELTPEQSFVITDADKAVCLGSGEILPCPFCGRPAHSVGKKNERSGNTVYHVICSGLHECGATVYCCCEKAEDARSGAIESWNKRA